MPWQLLVSRRAKRKEADLSSSTMIGMSAADVQAHASNGTTRLVVGPAALDLRGQRDEISAFADRLELR
jgi:hypothetical protein